MSFFFNKMVFFHIDMSLYLFFRVAYRQPLMVCFAINLLRRVVVLPTVNFFMVFVLVVQMTKFDPT